MHYLDIELLRLQADRALAEGRLPAPHHNLQGHGLAWMVLVCVLLTIPSTAPWFG